MILVQLHEKGAVNSLQNLHCLDPRIFSTIIIWSSNLFSNSTTGALASAVPLLPKNRLKAIIGDFSVFMWFANLYFSLFEGCINDLCELQGYTFNSLKAGSMIQMVSFTGAESTTYFIRWIHELNSIGDNHHYCQQVQWNPKCCQHYPDDTVWGPMHWGHATSQDLLHWTHLPIALYPGFHQFAFCLCLFINVRLSKQQQSVPLHLQWPSSNILYPPPCPFHEKNMKLSDSVLKTLWVQYFPEAL